MVIDGPRDHRRVRRTGESGGERGKGCGDNDVGSGGAGGVGDPPVAGCLHWSPAKPLALKIGGRKGRGG